MAIAAYVGGQVTERSWFKPPVLTGLAMSTTAYVWMGATWNAGTSYTVFALQLALLGAGFGLTVAPTTSAVVDAAPADQRGTAAALVMVVRLLGLSVGLSALTAWGLARFTALRSTIDLPSITDPGFEAALTAAQEALTSQAIAETFTAAAVVVGTGLLAAFAMKPINSHGDTMNTPGSTLTEVNQPVEGPQQLEHVAALTAPVAKRLNIIIGVLAVTLIGALALVGLLFSRLSSTQNALVGTQADMQRVEAGAALYASQITGFQEQLVALEPQVSAGVDEAIAGLTEFGNSTIAFDVAIDETIPIDTEVVIDRVVQVPIKTTIPIKQSFDTTIQVDTPFGKIPLDITVPVDVDVPVDLVVDIPINETVEIKDEFPVKLDVPIRINVRDTELAALTDSLAAGLKSLQDVLKGLS